jgi:hypothetical protein
MENELLENEGAVSATQPSMVSGGKIDVFSSECGNKLHHKKKDFYSQLLELKDYDADYNQGQFCGGSQDLVTHLQAIIADGKENEMWKKYGSDDDFEDYELIINALNNHFPDNEQVCVKQTSNGWHIIYKI